MTTDIDGRRAFVMTLRAREQDIRREKAASNICTNQALCALAASIYLAAIGPHGLRDVAALGAARAADLERALAAAGARGSIQGRISTSSPSASPDAPEVHRRLLGRGVLAGLALATVEPQDPSLADALLVCATEVTTANDIEVFARALRGEIERGRQAQPAGPAGPGGAHSMTAAGDRLGPPCSSAHGPGAVAARSRTRPRTRCRGSRPTSSAPTVRTSPRSRSRS